MRRCVDLCGGGLRTKKRVGMAVGINLATRMVLGALLRTLSKKVLRTTSGLGEHLVISLQPDFVLWLRLDLIPLQRHFDFPSFNPPYQPTCSVGAASNPFLFGGFNVY